MSKFAVRNLSVLAYAQGFTQWHYKATVAKLADVLAPGFFDSVSDMIKPHDHIQISAIDGGAVLYVFVSGDNGVEVRPMCQVAA